MNALVSIDEFSKVKVIKYIEDGEMEKVFNSISELSKYESFDISLKVCLSNSLELAKFCKNIDNIDIQALVYPDEASLKYKISTLITNFISSYYNFIEFCRSNSREWFGIEGYEKTKKIISSFYDEYYLYKFYAKFRNYITHKGLPIHSIIISNNKLKINLLSDKLLDDYKDWGADLKNELKSSSGHLNLITLFSKCNVDIAHLAKELHDFYYSQISKHKDYIISLIGEKIKNKHAYKLFVSSSLKKIEDLETQENTPLEITTIPFIIFGDP